MFLPLHIRWVDLPEELGDLLFGSGSLEKGASHKYIRKIRTASGKWRYFYTTTKVNNRTDMTEGAQFKLTHNGQVGHVKILKDHGDKITIRHDETGHTETIDKDVLGKRLEEEHGGAMQAERKASQTKALERARKDLQGAVQHGTAAHVRAALKAAHKAGGVPNVTEPLLMKLAGKLPEGWHSSSTLGGALGIRKHDLFIVLHPDNEGNLRAGALREVDHNPGKSDPDLHYEELGITGDLANVLKRVEEYEAKRASDAIEKKHQLEEQAAKTRQQQDEQSQRRQKQQEAATKAADAVAKRLPPDWYRQGDTSFDFWTGSMGYSVKLTADENGAITAHASEGYQTDRKPLSSEHELDVLSWGHLASGDVDTVLAKVLPKAKREKRPWEIEDAYSDETLKANPYLSALATKARRATGKVEPIKTILERAHKLARADVPTAAERKIGPIKRDWVAQIVTGDNDEYGFNRDFFGPKELGVLEDTSKSGAVLVTRDGVYLTDGNGNAKKVGNNLEELTSIPQGKQHYSPKVLRTNPKLAKVVQAGRAKAKESGVEPIPAFRLWQSIAMGRKSGDVAAILTGDDPNGKGGFAHEPVKANEHGKFYGLKAGAIVQTRLGTFIAQGEPGDVGSLVFVPIAARVTELAKALSMAVFLPIVLRKSSQPKTEQLKGGRADGKSPKEFDAKALEEGIAHELEHTSDRATAREITMDHLTEDPLYYRKLRHIEKSCVFKWRR